MVKTSCAAQASALSPPAFFAFLGATLLGAALLCGPATADPDPAAGPAAPAAAPAKSGSELEEIVVTAEKRESTVQATAISLSALSATDLSQQNIQTPEDLVGKVPGISLRTSGPGQTEYEARGLSAGGGAAATVGFYLDETPISASAIALNGRTVIDADLFDVNNVEVLRGPQGTLYGSGSMGGTIKLVTNQPKLDTFDLATDSTLSQTSGQGSTNGSGSLMLNIPIGDIAALRTVTTAKYISGWIDRIVAPPGEFPPPTNPGGTATAPPLCGSIYCTRGDVADMPVQTVVRGVNLERFASARAALLVKPTDDLSVTTELLYQRIDADGYDAYQQQPGTLAIYQPYDQPEPYYDSFKLASLKLEYNFGFATLTSATSYTARYVMQSEDATEALQNVFNTTHLVNGVYVADYIQSLYVEDDPTSQFAQEVRLTSKDSGPWQWVGGLYYSKLDSGYITHNQEPGWVGVLSCGLAAAAGPVSGSCPASDVYSATSLLRYPNPALPPYPNAQAANPNGVVFDDVNDEILKQAAIFGEATYKITDSLKLTGGIRAYYFQVNYHAQQAGFGTASGNQDAQLITQSFNNNATLPKVNLSYEPTQDLTVYGTIAKGSRPGGVNLPLPLPSAAVLAINPSAINCAAGPVSVSSQPSYSPDSVYSYEIGEKARFDDRRITVNSDFYYIKWVHIQQVLDLTCVYPYDTNAGNAKSYGPEVEVSALLTPGLTLDLSGVYNTAIINDPTAAAIESGILPGTRVLNVPRYTGNAAVNYHVPITDQLSGALNLTVTTVGSERDQSGYPQILPPYTLTDARAGISGGHWAAYLFGTNLTNRVVEESINNTNFAWTTYAITRVSTNQPRTIGVDFQYKY
ncbi:MAG TPA: TonB-dependent receptor [Steroidobacteraceae bacterium]|nr:TonB-dependent receptor [Steroidobacteraceae bacterium]